MTRTDVYDASLLGESAEVWTAFDYHRIRGRWSDEADGSGSRGTGRGEAVILTGNGRAKWVLEKWTNWEGEAVRHERMDGEDAREWLERNEFKDAVAEHFGGSLADALHDLREYREVTADRDRRIRAAKQAGVGVSEISREAGVSRPTVYEILGEKPGPGENMTEGGGA